MAATMELLSGIAATGKTHQLLGIYSTALDKARRQNRLGTTLWLAPNRRDTDEISRRLTRLARRALFAPQVQTFAEFADTVLERAAAPVVPLAPAQQRTLIRRIVERLRSLGRLPHFEPIAASSGFLDLVHGFISELKRSETWPEDFSAACQARGAGHRDRELASVYSAYQGLLVESQLFDNEGRFWWAREKLREGEWGPFQTLDLVVVDGFDDFTQTQYEILGMLAARAGRMIVSLPLESPLERRDLFAKTQAVAAELQRHAEVQPAKIPVGRPPAAAMRGAHSPREPGQPGMPAALEHLAKHLFGNSRNLPRLPTTEGLEIVSVAGQRGEVHWLAARVKALLLSGIPADDIVIVFRELDEYADLVRQTFHRAGIPAYVDSAEPLARAPVVRALQLFLQLETADWEYSALRAALNSPFFRPSWPEVADRAAVRRALQTLRALQLGTDRIRILEALRRLPVANSAANRPADATSALALLSRLDQSLGALRQTRPLTDWATVLAALADDLGLRAGSNEQPEDLVHWQSLLDALFAAGRTERYTGDEPRRLSLSEFLRELSDLIRQHPQKSAQSESGCVRVLSATEVRNLDIPCLFVAGLSEQSFPRRRSDDCLYGELDRRQLNTHGLTLEHHAQRTPEEMLLFYRVLTRARQQLVLSYPAVSPDGAPLSPSPYLTAVRELFEPGAALSQVEEQLSPIPPAGRVLSDADLRIRAMHDALSRRPELLAAAACHHSTGPSVVQALQAADMNAQRFHERGFTPYEGRLKNQENLARLAEKFSFEREFSATHLESYGECPFRFFVSRVLAVEPLVEIAFSTDHGERGSLIHSVLAQLHRELLVNGQPPTPPPPGSALAQRFTEILAQKRGERPATDPLREVVADLETEVLAEWGEQYGRQWDSYLEQAAKSFQRPPQPVLLERSFGARGKDDVFDGGSSHPRDAAAIAVGKTCEAVTLTGRIDRIDVGELDTGPVLLVIDYKSGSRQSLTRNDVALGRNLQLPIYLLAADRLQLAGPGVQPVQAAFWYLKGDGFTPALRLPRQRAKQDDIELLATADWAAVVEQLEAIVPRIVHRMQSGDFPVYNPDENCTRYCPYRLACRVSQIRPLAGHLGKTWTLAGAEVHAGTDRAGVAPPESG